MKSTFSGNRGPFKTIVIVSALLLLCCVRASSAIAEAPRMCTGCNFEGQKLENADFTGGTYIGSNFANADLRGSSFRQAKIIAANFLNADLRDVHFDNVECTACNFLGAQLDGATFSGARMIAANFTQFHAKVANDQLRQLLTQCVSCGFAQSSLAGRDFSGLTLISVDFTGADLRNSKFDGSVLCWYGVNGPKTETTCDKLNGAQLDGTSFQNTIICQEPMERVGCSNIDDDTLRRLSGGAINGIAPPVMPSPSPTASAAPSPGLRNHARAILYR